MGLPDARRWPGWVYETGEEPDYRFSFANERTFLAWVRTGLALIAAGVALDSFDVGLGDTAARLCAAVLVLLGGWSAGAAWWRWARSERAVRRGEPLPASWSTAVLTAGTLLVGLLVLLLGV
jgi:putative membrane protein